jgi:tetratricopeptide (TPR) repeat protein
MGQSLDDLGDVFDEQQDSEEEAAPPQDPPAADDEFDPFGTDEPAQATDQPQQPLSQEEVEKQVQEAMDQANALRAEGKPGQAIALYSRLLQAYPSFQFAEFEKAKTYIELKEYNFALTSLQALLDNYATPPEILQAAIQERAKLYMTLQQYDDALTDLNAAIQADPGSAELMLLRGKALTRSGQADPVQGAALIQQALPSLDRAIELDNTLADAYAERALARVAIQEFDSAVEDIQQAVELAGDNSNYLARQGSILSRRAEYEKGQHDANLDQVVADLKAAIASFDAYLAREGDKDKDAFKDAPPETVTPDIAYSEKASAVMNLAAESEPEEAKRLYQMAIEDCDASLRYDDRSWIPIYQRGLAERMLGSLHDAIGSFTHALKLSPSPEIHLRRGIAWYHLGEFARARADFRQAVETQQSRDGRAKFWVGATYAREGNFWEAIRYYSEALRENPEYKPAYNNRGLAYLQAGEYRRAANDFEELLRRNHQDHLARQRRDRALQLAVAQGQ